MSRKFSESQPVIAITKPTEMPRPKIAKPTEMARPKITQRSGPVPDDIFDALAEQGLTPEWSKTDYPKDETLRLLSLLNDYEKQILSKLKEGIKSAPADLERLTAWRQVIYGGHFDCAKDADVCVVFEISDDTTKAIHAYQILYADMHQKFRVVGQDEIHAYEFLACDGSMMTDVVRQAKSLVKECDDWLTIAARDRGIIGVGATLDESAIRQLWFKVKPAANIEPQSLPTVPPAVSPAATPPTPPAEIEPLTPELRAKAWEGLKPCERKAYLSWRYAEGKVERGLEDRAAYDFLKENGIEQNGIELGELTNYELPPFDSWCSYVIKSRGRLHENKNKSRGRPRKTRSIV